MKGHHRTITMRLLLAIGSPALIVCLLEVACRVSGFGYPTSFLIPFEIAGKQVWIDNQLFGYRFFSPSVSRAPSPVILPIDKSPDEFRVVILGESAAMGEPEPAYGPARMLQLFLTRRFPDRNVTVVNAAMTAINSHVIREIARELPKMKPDAVVLYIGNNEVVGPFGPGTVFNSKGVLPGLNRIRVILSRMQLASVIKRWWFSRSGSDAQTWQGMEMFQDRIPPDDPGLADVYTSFADNLDGIIGSIHAVGAKPVLCTVAVNLAALAPFHGAAGLLPTADLSALKKIRDDDQLRFRADSGINRMIRETAIRHAPGVTFSDIEAIFEHEGPPGNNYFLDHVHFNLSGSFLTAKAWDEAIATACADTTISDVTFADASNYVMWNPYGALDIAEKMRERFSRPPFTTTADQAGRMVNWNREIADIHRRIRSTPMDTLVTTFESRMMDAPEDFYLVNQAATALLHDDRYAEAGEYLERLHRIVPHRADVRGWLSIIDAISGNSSRAWDIMTRSAPPLGELPADMLASASETLYQGGFRAESLALLEIATRHFPQRLRLQSQLATRYAQTGNAYQSRKLFGELVSRHPDAHWIREEYGLLLAVSGDINGAEDMLGHLKSSNNLDDQIKWVQFLLFKQDFTGAEQRLKNLIDQQPSYARAYDVLIQIYSQQDKYEETVRLLQMLARIEPWRGDVWARLGGYYDLINRIPEAISSYEQAIRLLADPSGTMRSLAWLFATEEDPAIRNPERALAIMDQVLNMTGREDPYSLYVNAAALAGRQRYQDAVREIDSAMAEIAANQSPMLLDELTRARTLFEQGAAIRINRASGHNQ